MTTDSSVRGSIAGQSPWPVARFESFLTPNKRPYTLGPTEDANLVGMRLYGGGPFHRELKPAMKILKKSHFLIRKHDVIYNKLFAWKGSFGVVPEELDGMFVSDKFPTYHLDETLVSRDYLQWYFRFPELWEQARQMSVGSAALSKLTLNPPRFLDLTIPLPPREEQDRLARKLNAVNAKLEEAKSLHDKAKGDVWLLPIAMVHRTDLSHDQKLKRGWQEYQLGEIMGLVSDDVVVEASKEYPNFGIYSYGRGLFAKPAIDGLKTSATKLRCVHAGQFIYSRLFAWEGAYGVVPPEFDSWFVSNEYPTFDCDTSQILPEVLLAYFQAEHIWAELGARSRGLGSRRHRVQPEEILMHTALLPPMNVQTQIQYVSNRRTDLTTLGRERAVELDAMLPAILGKAFVGEL